MTRMIPLLLILLMGRVTVRADRFVTLDFNDLHIGESVLGHYDGGFGSSAPDPARTWWPVFGDEQAANHAQRG